MNLTTYNSKIVVMSAKGHDMQQSRQKRKEPMESRSHSQK